MFPHPLRLANKTSLRKLAFRADCRIPAQSPISDQGPGVPEKDLEAIFEPFYRLESARERATGGVGLGLAIVKSSIEACHGSVACRNRKPGLEVMVRLPAAHPYKPGSHGVSATAAGVFSATKAK